MPRPYASAVIPAPVDDVWTVVRDYNGLCQWHPDDVDRSYTYEILESPFAVRRYVATVRADQRQRPDVR